MLATTVSAVCLVGAGRLAREVEHLGVLGGMAIIIASWPAMNGSWFSVWVLVSAEVGTDLSRTYMS